jgi:RimJ/RimL family protein N-acetyltransferase
MLRQSVRAMVLGSRLPSEIWTERLLLRRWRPEDRRPFAALNADPVVMEFFPAPLTETESDHLVDRIELLFESQGYGLWAVEVLGGAPFAGFVGLNPADLTEVGIADNAVEVGWRLDQALWGKGYASEAASASLQYAFEHVRLPEVLSFTSTINVRSQHVMERIGMQRDPEADFDHPRIPTDSPLRRHLLYRISAREWRDRNLGRGGRAP